MQYLQHNSGLTVTEYSTAPFVGPLKTRDMKFPAASPFRCRTQVRGVRP